MGVVYGFHSAEEAILNQPERINHIWTASGSRTPRLHRLLEKAHRAGILINVVERAALVRLAGNQHHQDIVVEISPFTYDSAETLLQDITGQSLFCILDEIQDATNLGTLIRTMEGAGVQGVFLPERRSAAVTEVTHRLSAGALEHIRIARVTNISQLIDSMHKADLRIICADASATKLWHQADLTGPVTIMVGNEYKGVRRLLKEKSDELVRIPMLGKLQSLNVNVAAAILLYEVIRQRGPRS